MNQESTAPGGGFTDPEMGSSPSSSDSDNQNPRKHFLRKKIDQLAITKKFRRRTSSCSCGRTPSAIGRRRLWWKRAALVLFIILTLVGLLALLWFSFTLALLQRLSPPITQSGLHRIISNWSDNSTPLSVLSPWPEDFSQDIIPLPCHSHNDYSRHIPLYDALEAGCSGVEADIWFQDNDLYVGHSESSLTPARTLQSLYINPLVQILENQNPNRTYTTNGTYNGVFQTSPNNPLILLIDVKTDGLTTWPIALQQLEPLRERGFLTYFNGTDVVPSVLTVVGTGNTPFALLASNTTYRDAFFDAPLDNLTDQYNSQNSYYASVSLNQAVGKPSFGKLSTSQLETIESQVQAAASRGLLSRYWGTPAWPVVARDHVWSALVARDVGMLNVDDLVSAAKWNWDWCTILGFNLC